MEYVRAEANFVTLANRLIHYISNLHSHLGSLAIGDVLALDRPKYVDTTTSLTLCTGSRNNCTAARRLHQTLHVPGTSVSCELS